MIQTIIKRDGRCVLFDADKIASAIFKAAQALGGNDYEMAKALAGQVASYLDEQYGDESPSVEQIQDTRSSERSLRADMPAPPRSIFSTARSAPVCATWARA